MSAAEGARIREAFKASLKASASKGQRDPWKKHQFLAAGLLAAVAVSAKFVSKYFDPTTKAVAVIMKSEQNPQVVANIIDDVQDKVLSLPRPTREVALLKIVYGIIGGAVAVVGARAIARTYIQGDNRTKSRSRSRAKSKSRSNSDLY